MKGQSDEAETKKTNDMKNYSVLVNQQHRPFCEAQWLIVGYTPARSKAEAIEKIRAAAWGEENDSTVIHPEEVPAGKGPNYRTLKAKRD